MQYNALDGVFELAHMTVASPPFIGAVPLVRRTHNKVQVSLALHHDTDTGNQDPWGSNKRTFKADRG